MKTAMDMLDRLEALARKIADAGSPNIRYSEHLSEARAIVSELAPPVDPLAQQAREIVANAYEAGNNGAEQHRKAWAGHCRDGAYDSELPVVCTLTALRQAREQGREEGRGGSDVGLV